MAESIELEAKLGNGSGKGRKSNETELLIKLAKEEQMDECESQPRREVTGYEHRVNESKERGREKLKHLDEYESRKRRMQEDDNYQEASELEEQIEMEKKEFEGEMNKVLADGDYDLIAEMVTAYNLTKCKTNSLEKSFEVVQKLKKLASSNYPYEEDFLALAKKVEDFSLRLVDPLKGDAMKRAIFEGEDFDRVSEKAIFFEQKKFISHPVVYKLSVKRWEGEFHEMKSKPWSDIKATLLWIFIKIMTVVDFFFFAAIFALLYLVKHIARIFKKQYHVVFIMNASDKSKKQEMQALATSFLDLLRPEHTTYIVNKGIGIHTLDPGQLQETTFIRCLKTARKKFIDLEKSIRKSSDKLLIVLTDTNVKESFRSLRKEAVKVRNGHVRIYAVGLGVRPEIKELDTMATSKKDVLLYHGNVSKEDIAVRMFKSFKNLSLFERYLQYFTTPYIIYGRDFFSYFILLFLHLHLCFAPSPYLFDSVYLPMIFLFIGRIFMEIYQAAVHKRLSNKIRKPLLDQERWMDVSRLSEVESDYTTVTKKNRNKHTRVRGFCRAFLDALSGYLSDWWNVLDLVVVIVFLVTVTLRFLGWLTWYYVTWFTRRGGPFENNRVLAVSGYLVGLNTMFLTLRIFGHIMESQRSTGSIQIALFQIIGAVTTIFGQFTAIILAFSFAITKIDNVEHVFSENLNSTFYRNNPFVTYNEDRLIKGIMRWLQVIKHLLWSVLGMPELVDTYKSGDGPSDFLAQVLYGLFLLMAVVMLMNMMIALLSNTYQDVEDNAFFEWSYRRTTTIRTYVNYHPIPVPFNVFSFILIGVWKLCKYVLCIPCCVKVGKLLQNVSYGVEIPEDNCDGESYVGDVTASFFDCLVYDLQDEYFSKYGYGFPNEEPKSKPPELEEKNKENTAKSLAKTDEESAELLAKLCQTIESLQSHSIRQEIIQKLESKFDNLESKLDKHEMILDKLEKKMQ